MIHNPYKQLNYDVVVVGGDFVQTADGTPL